MQKTGRCQRLEASWVGGGQNRFLLVTVGKIRSKYDTPEEETRQDADESDPSWGQTFVINYTDVGLIEEVKAAVRSLEDLEPEGDEWICIASDLLDDTTLIVFTDMRGDGIAFYKGTDRATMFLEAARLYLLRRNIHFILERKANPGALHRFLEGRKLPLDEFMRLAKPDIRIEWRGSEPPTASRLDLSTAGK